jgi:ParB/RepB/Spo0J family partition protein
MLLNTKPNPVDGQMDDQILLLDPQAILPSAVQPRLPHNNEQLLGLAASLRRQGVLQPVAVYWDDTAGAYRLIHGERRWRSARQAGLPALPCLVHQAKPSFAAFLQMTVGENEERAELTPMELAWALHTFHLLANLEALAGKYSHLARLATIEAEVEATAAAVAYGDEVDQAATRQQAVIDFLEAQLEAALATIDKMPASWRPLVSWDECICRLGIDYLPPRRRRQLLELLNLADGVQVEVAHSRMSHYAARELAGQPAAVQAQIVQAAKQNGGLDALTQAAINEMASQFTAGDLARHDDESGNGATVANAGPKTTAGRPSLSPTDEYQPTLPFNGLPAVDPAHERVQAQTAALTAFEQAVALCREVESLAVEYAAVWQQREVSLLAEWLSLIARAAGLELEWKLAGRKEEV